MEKLDYGPNAVCFRDYEVGGEKVFLELSVKEEQGVFKVNLLPRYPSRDNTNVVCIYDGKKLIAKRFITTFYYSTLNIAHKRVDDISYILKDPIITETVEDIIRTLSQ